MRSENVGAIETDGLTKRYDELGYVSSKRSVR